MSSFRPLLSSTVALTSIELLAVADPRLGMQWTDLLLWFLSAHMLYGLYAFVVWTVLKGRFGPKQEPRHCLGLGLGLIGLVTKMDFAVNLFMRDPHSGSLSDHIDLITGRWCLAISVVESL